MVISHTPQFATQHIIGEGEGIVPIPQWYEATTHHEYPSSPHLDDLDLDLNIRDTLLRLRILFHESQTIDLSTTDLHDLTCFALHRLLAWSPTSHLDHTSQKYYISEIVLCGTALYMLLIHGPTYFSHAMLQHNLTVRLKTVLEHSLAELINGHPSLAVWLLSVGMLATKDTPEALWFNKQAEKASYSLCCNWKTILQHLQDILWFRKPLLECAFQQTWEAVWASMYTAIT